MTEDRIKKLEAVDRWVWSPRGLEWDVRLSELQKYKAEHGDCLVPRNYSATPQLGAWVHCQRLKYKWLKNGRPSSITKDRVDKLEAIKGWVWVVP